MADSTNPFDMYRTAVDAALGGVVEPLEGLIQNGLDLRRPVPPGAHLDHLPNQASALLLTATAHALHRPALFSLLLAHGAQADTLDSKGQTPVLLLCRNINEYPQTLETLLTAGASPIRLDDAGYAPLHYAAARNHIRLVKILLVAGAVPNSRAADGSTPLHWAAAAGAVSVHQYLRATLDNESASDFSERLSRAWYLENRYTFGALRLSAQDGAWESLAFGTDSDAVTESARHEMGPIRGTASPLLLFRISQSCIENCPPNPWCTPGREMKIAHGDTLRLTYFAPAFPRGIPDTWETPPRFRFALTPADSSNTATPRQSSLSIETTRLLEYSEWGERDLPFVTCAHRDGEWTAR